MAAMMTPALPDLQYIMLCINVRGDIRDINGNDFGFTSRDWAAVERELPSMNVLMSKEKTTEVMMGNKRMCMTI